MYLLIIYKVYQCNKQNNILWIWIDISLFWNELGVHVKKSHFMWSYLIGTEKKMNSSSLKIAQNYH